MFPIVSGYPREKTVRAIHSGGNVSPKNFIIIVSSLIRGLDECLLEVGRYFEIRDGGVRKPR